MESTSMLVKMRNLFFSTREHGNMAAGFLHREVQEITV
jgi:hypothetical protein